MSCTLRMANAGDAAAILELIQDLAAYEKEPDAVEATVDSVATDLRGDSAVKIECVLAELEGVVIGMALFFHTYSTWRGKPGLYLEDLFVKPAYRGMGAGMALMARLASIAKTRDCARFEWACLDWNEPSIKFYQALGAKPMAGWSVFRLEGEALARLAEEG